MKKTLVTALLFVLMTASAAAVTVLLFTRNISSEEHSVEAAFYMEDGIMGKFFDAGFIIFNTTEQAEPDSPPFPFHQESRSVRLAKSGGATILFEVDLFYRSAERGETPWKAEYRLYNLATNSILGNGSVTVSEVNNRNTISRMELVRELGKLVADKALSRM